MKAKALMVISILHILVSLAACNLDNEEVDNVGELYERVEVVARDEMDEADEEKHSAVPGAGKWKDYISEGLIDYENVRNEKFGKIQIAQKSDTEKVEEGELEASEDVELDEEEFISNNNETTQVVSSNNYNNSNTRPDNSSNSNDSRSSNSSPNNETKTSGSNSKATTPKATTPKATTSKNIKPKDTAPGPTEPKATTPVAATPGPTEPKEAVLEVGRVGNSGKIWDNHTEASLWASDTLWTMENHPKGFPLGYVRSSLYYSDGSEKYTIDFYWERDAGGNPIY